VVLAIKPGEAGKIRLAHHRLWRPTLGHKINLLDVEIQTTIEGLGNLQNKLQQLAKNAEALQQKSVVVGYTSSYAVPVHENVEMKLKGKPRPSGIGKYWGPRGQPKYLEQPAREMEPELRRIIEETAQRTGDVLKGLYLAGLKLQGASQKRVPIEYGFLRASAFTAVE
jgi:hypothetical protein